jgi:hypothetical protein
VVFTSDQDFRRYARVIPVGLHGCRTPARPAPEPSAAKRPSTS